MALNSALFLIWTKREQIWLCERYEWCACAVDNVEAAAKSSCYLIPCKNHQPTMIHILFLFFRLFAVHLGKVLTHFESNENHNEVSSIPLSIQCRISGMNSWRHLQLHHTAFCCRHGLHYFLLAITHTHTQIDVYIQKKFNPSQNSEHVHIKCDKLKQHTNGRKLIYVKHDLFICDVFEWERAYAPLKTFKSSYYYCYC